MCELVSPRMAEDWRLTVELEEEGIAARLLSSLHVQRVEAEARRRLGDRVAVSGSRSHVLVYADSEEAAREAQRVVTTLLEAGGERASYRLDRWHPLEEAWEDASHPLPATAAEQAAEHERLEALEARESRATGVAEWEVRIELASHAEAEAAAERLRADGFTHVVRRSSYLLVGAVDRDEADDIATRLSAELAPGARLAVEPGSGTAWPSTPFAVFGGLAS